MKKIFITLALATSVLFTYAQWTPSTAATGPIYYNGGNVGIGTNYPGALLHVNGINDGGIVNNLALGNDGGIANSRTAIYMGLQYAGLGLYGARILQTGTPSDLRSADLSFQIHNGIASNADAAWDTPFFIQRTTGNVGIGTTSPGYLLDVNGDSHFAGRTAVNYAPQSNIRSFIYDNSSNYGLVVQQDGAGPIASFTTGGVSRLYVSSDGNVGIGTTSPDAKLSVNGTIHTKEVKVDLTGWPDYVFEPKYKLPSLNSIENYIDQNHHLPEMPSTQEVLKNGVNLGEMVNLQTKKIEELTLYLIEQQKINQSLQKQIDQLLKKN